MIIRHFAASGLFARVRASCGMGIVMSTDVMDEIHRRICFQPLCKCSKPCVL